MRLQDYLACTGTTRAQFAEQIGVSVETVRRYLAGERRPDWEILSRIDDATKGAVTANDFVKVAA